jgi:hypothetical protein
MTCLSNVYAKFGEVAEAVQLLETELGNMLLSVSVAEYDLVNKPDTALARKIFSDVDRKTLGQLIRDAQAKVPTPENLEELLVHALRERNRLNHAFYRQHNFRRNSAEGRVLMLEDLEHIHDQILDAYKALMLLNGVDLDNVAAFDLPTDHLPLK